jgi:arylsulfatase A-like enzyme
VELTDLLPTCLEIAGAPEADRGTHGVSLLPLLTGEGAVSRDYAFGEIYGWVVAADQRYRFIHQLDGDGALLFDEINDPENELNIADQRPEVVAAMKQAIDRWLEETGPLKEPGVRKESKKKSASKGARS